MRNNTKKLLEVIACLIFLSLASFAYISDAFVGAEKMTILVLDVKSAEKESGGYRESEVLDMLINSLKKKEKNIVISKDSAKEIRGNCDLEQPASLMKFTHAFNVDLIIQGELGRLQSRLVTSLRRGSGFFIGANIIEPDENAPKNNMGIPSVPGNTIASNNAYILNFKIISGYSGDILCFGTAAGVGFGELNDSINDIEVPVRKARVTSIDESGLLINVGTNEGLTERSIINIYNPKKVLAGTKKKWDLVGNSYYNKISAEFVCISAETSYAKPKNIGELNSIRAGDIAEIVVIKRANKTEN